MDCRTFYRNLEDYLEGGLDFPGRFGMERHAQQCYLCGREVADAQRLSELSEGLKRTCAPPDFEEAVMARIHTRERHGWFRSFWFYGFEWPSRRTLAVSTGALGLIGVGAFAAVSFFQVSRNTDAVVVDPLLPASPAKVAAVPVAAEFLSPPVEISSLASPVDVDTPPEPKAPLDASLRGPGRRISISTEDESAAQLVDPGDRDYVEYAVPGPGDRQFIMRLPKTIRMRYGQPSDEYFVRNVSH